MYCNEVCSSMCAADKTLPTQRSFWAAKGSRLTSFIPAKNFSHTSILCFVHWRKAVTARACSQYGARCFFCQVQLEKPMAFSIHNRLHKECTGPILPSASSVDCTSNHLIAHKHGWKNCVCGGATVLTTSH